MPVSTRSHSTTETLDESNPEQVNTNMAAKKILTLEDVMSEIRNSAADTNKKLTIFETKFDKSQETLTNYMKLNDEAIAKLKAENEKCDNRLKAAEDTVKTLEDRVSQLSNDVEALARNNRIQKIAMEKLEEKDKKQEIEKKRQNIVIEGLSENDRENPRQAAVSMIASIGVDRADDIVASAFRLGIKKPTQTRPRPLLVKLQTQASKHIIYKNVKKLKD